MIDQKSCSNLQTWLCSTPIYLSIFGHKLNIRDDNTFQIEVSAFEFGQWKKENLKAIAFVTREMTPQRVKNQSLVMVLGSNDVPFGQLLSSQDITNDKPNVRIENNYVRVEGSFDSILVLDLSCSIFATNTETPLLPGNHIIRVNAIIGNYTYKVLVQR